jgi:hypothetical protein
MVRTIYLIFVGEDDGRWIQGVLGRGARECREQ